MQSQVSSAEVAYEHAPCKATQDYAMLRKATWVGSKSLHPRKHCISLHNPIAFSDDLLQSRARAAPAVNMAS